jgi:hypothetical protein
LIASDVAAVMLDLARQNTQATGGSRVSYVEAGGGAALADRSSI